LTSFTVIVLLLAEQFCFGVGTWGIYMSLLAIIYYQVQKNVLKVVINTMTNLQPSHGQKTTVIILRADAISCQQKGSISLDYPMIL